MENRPITEKSEEETELNKIIAEYSPLPTTREEFYSWIKPEIKAEWIDGKVVIQSPALARHLDSTLFLAHLFKCYFRSYGVGGKLSLEKALCIFPKNNYEPDICYWGPEKSATISPEDWRHPVPDFIVEVLSKDTARRDRGVKMEDYERNGVKEYWIVDAKLKKVECYVLDATAKYRLVSNPKLLCPTFFPDLAFPEAAVFSETVNNMVCNAFSLPTYAEEARRAWLEAADARKEAEDALLRELEARKEEQRARREAEDAMLRELEARKETSEAKKEAIAARKETSEAKKEALRAIKETSEAKKEAEEARLANERLKRLALAGLTGQGLTIERLAEITGLSSDEIQRLLDGDEYAR